MIYIENFIDLLKKNKINFFTGVPDSVLKMLGSSIEKSRNHIIASNEGAAVSIAAGYYLSTKKIPMIYMQNSGLGNAVNPLLSITHKEVYSIPLVMIIGWRGAPGLNDEPQYKVTGRITKKLLKTMNIKYCILEKESDLLKFQNLIRFSKKYKTPIACLLKNNTLITKKKFLKKKIVVTLPSKAEAITGILKNIGSKSHIISTTGYTSRELNNLRKDKGLNKGKDFYMIGGMGHSSSVALGVSLFKKDKNIICLDGDGSMLMHMGSLATIGYYGTKNFKHVLLNNYIHESVGGQKTNSENIDFKKLSISLGYSNYSMINKKFDLEKKIISFLNKKGPSFLEIKIREGATDNLGRPKNFLKIKKEFMK